MVPLEDRCMASIDGPKVGARVVAWRKYCKNRKQKGFSTCRHHPLMSERAKWEEYQKSKEVK